MSREFVLLTPQEVTTEHWVAAADAFVRDGQGRRFVGDLTQLIGDGGAELVSFWPSRPLGTRREADRMLGRATETYDFWTDVVVPLTDDSLGVQIVAAVTAQVQGTLIERN